MIEYESCLFSPPDMVPRIPPTHVHPEMRKKMRMLKTPLQRQTVADDLCCDEKTKNIIVIGGGWAACDFASKVGADKQKQVTMLMPESGVLRHYIPKYIAKRVQKRLVRKLGVEIMAYSCLQYVSPVYGGVNMMGEDTVSAGEVTAQSVHDAMATTSCEADTVIFAPTRLAVDTSLCTPDNGLEQDAMHGGLVVNTQLLAVKDLFVAGGGASYFDPVLGRRREQCAEHSRSSGAVAAANMCGDRCVYDHMPTEQWLLPTIGVSAATVGLCDAGLESHGFWIRRRKRRRRQKESGKAGGKASGNASMWWSRGGHGSGSNSSSSGSREKGRASIDDDDDDDDDDSDAEDSEKDSESSGGDNHRTNGAKTTKSRGKRASEVFGTGVVFYVRGGMVVGVMFWGGSVGGEGDDARLQWARRLLREQHRARQDASAAEDEFAVVIPVGANKEEQARALLPVGTAVLTSIHPPLSPSSSSGSRPVIWQHDPGMISRRGKGGGNVGATNDYGGVGAGIGLTGGSTSGGTAGGAGTRDWSMLAEQAGRFPWPPSEPTRSTRSAELLFHAASSVQNRRAMKDAYRKAIMGETLKERTDTQLHNANPLRNDRPWVKKKGNDEGQPQQEEAQE
jgi:hypothetical protein